MKGLAWLKEEIMLCLPHAELLLARLLHWIVSLQQAFLDKRQDQFNFSKLSFPKGLSFWKHCPYLHCISSSGFSRNEFVTATALSEDKTRHYLSSAHLDLQMKYILIFLYIKACVQTRPNSARALLAFPVTYFPIRNRTTYKQTTVLDKSDHGCGRFNEIKANRITTHRYM